MIKDVPPFYRCRSYNSDIDWSVSTLLTSGPAVYLFLLLWAGRGGNSRFYWFGGLWYGFKCGCLTSLFLERRDLWPLSVFLTKFPKRKQLSARPGAWTWFIGCSVYRRLIAVCPRAAVNWYLLISRPLAEMGREGWENDISVNNHTWF